MWTFHSSIYSRELFLLFFCSFNNSSRDSHFHWCPRLPFGLHHTAVSSEYKKSWWGIICPIAWNRVPSLTPLYVSFGLHHTAVMPEYEISRWGIICPFPWNRVPAPTALSCLLFISGLANLTASIRRLRAALPGHATNKSSLYSLYLSYVFTGFFKRGTPIT